MMNYLLLAVDAPTQIILWILLGVVVIAAVAYGITSTIRLRKKKKEKEEKQKSEMDELKDVVAQETSKEKLVQDTTDAVKKIFNPKTEEEEKLIEEKASEAVNEIRNDSKSIEEAAPEEVVEEPEETVKEVVIDKKSPEYKRLMRKNKTELMEILRSSGEEASPTETRDELVCKILSKN